MLMSDGVLAQLAALPAKKTPELRAMWRDLYGTEPPLYNRRYLESRLAFRIQELSFGGLSAETRARIDALVEEEEERLQGKPRARRPVDRPIAGTVLIREFRGVEHRVTTLSDGFEYQGQKFESLSPIARRITGTRWNGPLFFGLRNAGRRK